VIGAYYVIHYHLGALIWLLFVPIAVVLIVYVVLPLRLRRKMWHAAHPKYVPTQVEHLTPLAQEGIRRLVHELAPDGFTVAANLHLAAGSGVSNTAGVIVLLVNRQEQAQISGISAVSGANAHWAVVATTLFADGSRIVTANSSHVSGHPRNPSVDVINVPWIRNTRRLYAIHRARVAASSRASQPRVLPDPGREAAFLEDQWRDEMQRLQRGGYYWLDDSPERYRMTLKGAYIMTWRLLPPFRQLRMALAQRKARRVLRALGFADEADSH
jgi:hypothetical protein